MPVDEVAKAVADAGLTVGATHTPWPRLLSELDDVIAEHQVLGCHHTAIGMIPPDSYLSLAGLNQFVEEARLIVDTLGASGITFSIITIIMSSSIFKVSRGFSTSSTRLSTLS